MRIRPERVAHLIQREISELLERELRDPRLQGHWVSVTGVDVTDDLSSARVFVSMLEGGPSRQEALAALERASGFLRHALAPRLGLREVPELRFLFDDSIERGSRVEDLLRRLARGETIPDEDAP